MARVPGKAALGVGAGLALAVWSCAAPPWTARELAVREPALAAVRGHRLEDVHPYVLPWRSQVHLFLCRWNTATPVGVSLSDSADAGERRALESALRALEGLGLGLRFEQVRADEASLVIELADGSVQTAAGMGAGRSVADCRVDPASLGAGATRLEAELVAARVELARSAEDVRGLRVPLSPEELAGAALHELGHALGFQGHVRRGETPLVRTAEVHRRLGGRLLAGENPDEPSLRALYALPSGVLLASPAVSRWRTDLVDRMGALAAAEGLEGPFARVGDTAARVFWRDAAGREYGLQIPNLDETLRDPSRVLVVAESATRAALPRSRDLAP